MSVKIIAEIGWNHMGDMVLAEDMIRAASESGADMVKFQYWDPKFLRPGPWDDDGRIEIYRKAALDSEKIQILQKISSENNVEFLISVFGTIGAKFIKDLDIDIIKIPSHETINIDLINFCAKNFTSEELQRAKAQFKASLLMGQESTSRRCRSNASKYLMHNKIISHEDIISKIDAIQNDDLEKARINILKSKITLSSIGPVQNLENLENVKNRISYD